MALHSKRQISAPCQDGDIKAEVLVSMRPGPFTGVFRVEAEMVESILVQSDDSAEIGTQFKFRVGLE